MVWNGSDDYFTPSSSSFVMPELVKGANIKKLLCLLLTVISVSSSTEIDSIYIVCPVAEPCACIDPSVVMCAYKRLYTLPHIVEFAEKWNEMDVSQNFIERLPPFSFNGMKVKILNLRKNTIRVIEMNAFAGILDIEVLDLSHNTLKHIKKGVFALLDKLKVLKLRYNNLHRINDDAFYGLDGVTEIDLTGNEFTRVPSKLLQSLRGLKRLILRNNKIQELPGYAFYGLPLDYLDLGNNVSPTYITDEAFCGLEPKIVHSEHNVVQWSGLTTLRLDHNGIQSLNPCITASVWTLATIDVSGNPLHCDCRIFLFRESGTRTSFPEGQCASPDQYAGRLIDRINPREYNCHWNVTTQHCAANCRHTPVALVNGGAVGQAAAGGVGGVMRLTMILMLLLLCCCRGWRGV